MVSARLTALGMDHELFPAVDGTLGEHKAFHQYDDAACLRQFGKSLSPQEIGCFASHYQLWRQCAKERVPVLILEDDVTILDGFPHVLELAKAHLQEFAMIRLFAILERSFRGIRHLGAYQVVRYLRGPQGTQAYVLSPEGAEALLRVADRWVEPVDHFLDRFWAHGLPPHAILPFEIVHDEAAERSSTIGNRRTKRRPWRKAQREFNSFRDRVSRWIFNARN